MGMIPGLEPSKPLSLCESSPGNPVKDIYEGVVASDWLLSPGQGKWSLDLGSSCFKKIKNIVKKKEG